jgi:hypothetical protein
MEVVSLGAIKVAFLGAIKVAFLGPWWVMVGLVIKVSFDTLRYFIN